MVKNLVLVEKVFGACAGGEVHEVTNWYERRNTISIRKLLPVLDVALRIMESPREKCRVRQESFTRRSVLSLPRQPGTNKPRRSCE